MPGRSGWAPPRGGPLPSWANGRRKHEQQPCIIGAHRPYPNGICISPFQLPGGVGNSQGVHAQGEEEAEDAEAALSLLKDRPEVDGARVGMAGYSFGSGVILGSLARYSNSRAFVLFSPSV